MKEDRRFSVQAAADANYLDVVPDEPVRLDELALRMLQEDKPEFFLGLQVRTMNARMSLRYRLQNAVSLSNSVGGALKKREYLTLALGLLTPFMKCRDWFLDYHYICIDPRFILHDRHSDSYLFVYIPEGGFYNDDNDIISFFESVLNYIDISDDREYQIDIMHYFRGGNVTLSEMWQMFTTEREKLGTAQSQHTEYRQPAPSQNTVKTQPQNQPYPQTNNQAPQPSQPAADTNAGSDSKPRNAQKSSFLDKLIGKKKPEASRTEPMSRTEPNIQSNQTTRNESSAKAQDKSDANSDEMIEELFGSKKSKKPAVDTKSSGAKSADTAKPEKKSGLFGFSQVNSKSDAKTTKGAANNNGASNQNGAPNSTGALYSTGASNPTAAPYSTGANPNEWANQSVPNQGSSNSGYPQMNVGDAGLDETSIGDAEFEKSYLELIDSRFDNVPQHIALDFDKPFVSIGRRTADGPQPDIAFPEHCRGISRMHARIVKSSGGLELIDLGSTYHTLLDGSRLVPNMNYPLRNGMILTLVEDKPVRYRVHISN